MAFEVGYRPGDAYSGQTPDKFYARYRDNFFATSTGAAANPGGAPVTPSAGDASSAADGSAATDTPDATAPADSGNSGNLAAELSASNGGDHQSGAGDQSGADTGSAAADGDFTMGALYS